MLAMSSTPFAVVISDAHLKPHTWVDRREIAEDTYVAWEAAIARCCRDRLPLILLGDTFDKRRPDSQSLAVFTRAMDRLEHLAVGVYYIQGNHDYADPPWPSVHSHPQHLHKQQWRIRGVEFYGLDYTPPDLLAAELAAIPAGAIFLSHQSWAEIQQVGRTDASLSQLPPGTMMLAGDCHITGKFTAGDTVAYSFGALSRQSFAEPDEHFYGLLSLDADGKVVVDTQPVPSRVVLAVRCSDAANVDELLTILRREPDITGPKLPEPITKPILRVAFAADIPEFQARVQQVVGDRYHLAWLPQSTAPELAETVANKDTTLQDVVVAVCGKVGIDASLPLALLRGGSPVEDIRRAYENFIATESQANTGK